MVMMKNITVSGGICPVTQTWLHLVPLLRQGQLETAGMFSHQFNLKDRRQAFRLYDSRDDGTIKIMIDVE